jgi:hypothetical protein
MKSDQNMQLSKTWQTFAVKDLSPSCKIYGRSGMMQNGIAYRLPPLAHLTDGIESGLLPTPLASAKSDCPSERMKTESALGDGCKNATDPDCKRCDSGEI